MNNFEELCDKLKPKQLMNELEKLKQDLALFQEHCKTATGDYKESLKNIIDSIQDRIKVAEEKIKAKEAIRVLKKGIKYLTKDKKDKTQKLLQSMLTRLISERLSS